MTDATKRFGDRAGDYARFRPEYPPEIIDAILDGYDRPTVADLGAGTGISARLLASAGATVYAVEPNLAMREAMTADTGLIPVDGTAEQTHLPTASVDIIGAFQSYHWFAVDAVMREAKRIRRSRSRFAAVWNNRDRGDAFTDAYEAIVDRYDTSGGAISASRKSGAVLDDLRVYGWRDARVVVARHRQSITWDALIGLARSSSYLPRSGDVFETMQSEFRSLYAQWEKREPALVWCTEAYLADA